MDLNGRTAQPGMTEREHHEWGALLKYVEALATAYRYGRYPRNSKTGKLFERFLAATRQLREQLNWEYGRVATEHLLPEHLRPEGGWAPGEFYDRHWDWVRARDQALRSNVYYGDEVRYLHQQLIALDQAPTGWVRKMFAPDPNEFEVFKETIGQLVNTARSQTQKLPWDEPAALPLTSPPLPTPAPADPARSDRCADLRAALIANPDQPQAVFVRRFRVHPDTVRRCRRELEEAEVIPVLTHRLRPASRRAMAVAAD